MKRDVVAANGLKLRLWNHEGSGPTILFVHGYLDTGRSFDDVAALLPDHHCLAIDMRGHGDSDRVGAGGSYHLLDHVKDLAVVLQTTKPDLLVGHSMGGNVALLVAGSVPRLVPRLLLVDTIGAPPEDPEEQPARIASVIESVLAEKRPFSSVRSLDEAIAKLRAQNGGLSEDGARRMVRDVMVHNADGTLSFPFASDLRGPTPTRWADPMWLALCSRLTMPVTVVRAQDGYVGEGEMFDKRVAAMRADVVTVPGPHHVHVENPAAVAAACRSLCEKKIA